MGDSFYSPFFCLKWYWGLFVCSFVVFISLGGFVCLFFGLGGPCLFVRGFIGEVGFFLRGPSVLHIKFI